MSSEQGVVGSNPPGCTISIMNYLAILGRQPEISLAELKAQFSDVKKLSPVAAAFVSEKTPNINRLGGVKKLARQLDQSPIDFLKNLPDGKIVLGISDYSDRPSRALVSKQSLRLKKTLKNSGRSVRLLLHNSTEVPSATAHHNFLGEKPTHVELIFCNKKWYISLGSQNITAYAKRDQARPARDAKVGMLPPKLAQILINLCGPLPENARLLDPFCGTGVVLQEAALMDYSVYGTDLSERMVNYSEKNLKWLQSTFLKKSKLFMKVEVGDATNHTWSGPIDAVAAEVYLGPPMSQPPVDIKLKTAMEECGTILLGFLKNLSTQIEPNTPVVLGVPAWLRPDGSYKKMNLKAQIESIGFAIQPDSGLLYHRPGQIVAREILILRKK